MTQENKYREQLSELGVYQPAFDPEIKTLCQLERELRRVNKAWHATCPKGVTPSVLDKHYAVMQQLRRDILTHREALGLTPKALARLRGKNSEPAESATAALSKTFDKLWEAVTQYE